MKISPVWLPITVLGVCIGITLALPSHALSRQPPTYQVGDCLKMMLPRENWEAPYPTMIILKIGKERYRFGWFDDGHFCTSQIGLYFDSEQYTERVPCTAQLKKVRELL